MVVCALKLSTEELVKMKVSAVICCLLSFLSFKLSEAEPVYITEWEGGFNSPNYPKTYPPNSNLTWISSVSPGNRVEIYFQDFMTECNTDYLEIRDGDSVVSPLIGRYCGNNEPPKIISSGTSILLKFVSGNVTNKLNRGFTLQHSGVCTVHTNQTSGVITSPNYPNDYPNYMDCMWTIELHPAMLIPLVCDGYAIEYSYSCGFDYMEIIAGVTSDSPALGKYCGVFNESLAFERDGDISIRFVSDQDKEKRGFRCSYNIFKVRGYWTQWTEWTECSQTCRHGNQTRNRTCVNPLPESGLELLCSDLTETETRSCFICGVTSSSTSSSTSLNNSISSLPSSTSVLSSSYSGHTGVSGHFHFTLSSSHSFTNMFASQGSAVPSSSHSLVTTFLSQSLVNLSESHSSVKPPLTHSGGMLSANDFLNTPTASQPHVTISLGPSGYGVTPSSAQSGATLSAGHDSVTSQLGARFSTSHFEIMLFSSQFYTLSPHSGILPSSRYDATTSESHSLVTVGSNQVSVLLPSDLYNGTQSSSLPHVTLSLRQYGVTLSTSHSNVTPNKSLASHIIVTSPSKPHVTQAATLATLQETVENTKRFGGTVHSTLSMFHALNTSFLSDRAILHSFQTGGKVNSSARQTTTSVLFGDSALSVSGKPSTSGFSEFMITNNMLMLNYSSGQLRHDHIHTSDIGYSASLTAGTNSQRHQSKEPSGTVLPFNVNNSQNSIVTAINVSASIAPSLSAMGGQVQPNTVNTSQIAADDSSDFAYSSNKDSSGLSTPNHLSDTRNPYQGSIQMAQLTSSNDMAHIPTSLANTIFDATKSSILTSKPSVLKNKYNETLTIQSSHHLQSDVSILTGHSTAFVHDMFTNRLASASVQTRDGTILSTIGSTERATSAKLSSFSQASGSSTVGRPSDSLVLETGPPSFSLTTGLPANTDNQNTPTLTLSKGDLNTVGVQTSQQVESTASFSIPSRTDSGIVLMRQTATGNLLSIHSSSRMYSDHPASDGPGSLPTAHSRLASQTHQGLESTATVSIPFWTEVKTLSMTESVKVNSFVNSDHPSSGMYLLSATHTRLAAHTPPGLVTTAKYSIPPADSRAVLIKNTTSGNTLSNQPDKGMHPSLTRDTRFVTQVPVHTSFRVPISTSAVSAISSTTVAPTNPTDMPDTTPALTFPWHLIPFVVIVFLILVVLATYYLRIPDLVEAIILAIKEKRKQMKESKLNNDNLDNANFDLTKGNFSTEGLQTSHFHSYQREVFYEEALNYAFFEMAAMKTVEFSVRLEDEDRQSSGSEESVEISCEMEEETADKKQGSDTLSEMFQPSGPDIPRQTTVKNIFPFADPRRNRMLHLQDSPSSYEI